MSTSNQRNPPIAKGQVKVSSRPTADQWLNIAVKIINKHRTIGNQPIDQGESEESNGINPDLIKCLKNISDQFLLKCRIVASAPRVTDVRHQFKEIANKAGELSDLLKHLNQDGIALLSEMADPVGAFGYVNSCELVPPLLANLDGGLDGLNKFRERLDSLKKSATATEKWLQGVDKGGSTDLEIYLHGTGIAFLIIKCTEIFTYFGIKISHTPGSVFEDFVKAIHGYSTGNANVDIQGTQRRFSEAKKKIQALEDDINLNMSKFNKIGIAELVKHSEDGTTPPIEAPSTDQTKDLLPLTQQRTRLQMGVFPPRKRS